MLGTIAALVGGSWCTGKYEGCAETRTKPPKPTCGLMQPTSPRGVVAALVRSDPQWLLARDADDGAVVIAGSKSIFVFPATERRTPEAALADLVLALSPDARTALKRTHFLLVWLGREHDATGEGVRYPSWERGLELELFHDVLTPQGCLMRETPADDPENHMSRRHSNEHMSYIAKADAALVKVLRDGHTAPLSADESAARMAIAAPQLHEIAMVTLRENYAPISALVIVGLMLVFYWWAASAGKEESFIELEDSELRGDGALVAPGRIDLRVLSHALLHADLKHLINNAFSLWIGCAILEAPIGSARTLLVFLAGVIGGALLRLRLKKPGLVIGASGGAFALQAAALVLLLRSGVWFLPSERTGYIIFIVIQLVFNLVASFMPGVSMAGHVGGALAGFLITVTGLVLIGRPPLDGGAESAFSAQLAWIIAGVAVAAWVTSGVLVQRGRTDLKPDATPQKG